MWKRREGDVMDRISTGEGGEESYQDSSIVQCGFLSLACINLHSAGIARRSGQGESRACMAWLGKTLEITNFKKTIQEDCL